MCKKTLQKRYRNSAVTRVNEESVAGQRFVGCFCVIACSRAATRLILVPERVEENGMGLEGGSLILGIQS